MLDNETIDAIRRGLFEEIGVWISRKTVRGLVTVLERMAHEGKEKQ